MRSQFAVALLLGTLAFSPRIAWAADETHSLEQLVVETAHTRGEHTALAEHYRAKAADARADAAHHEAMAKTYGASKLMDGVRQQDHCKKIAADDTAMATEYDALAKLHDDEAKKAK